MSDWQYAPTPDYDQSPIERLKNFPRQPHMVVYALRSIANLIVRAILRVFHRIEIIGRENLPATESFVLVANHSSHLDAPALLAALPWKQIHRAFPAAAADYFFTNLPAVAFSAIVMNAMPFDRKENPKHSVDLCRQLLESPGHVLILFPEGTRTVTGEIGPFKPGIGFLIAGTSVPIVPCHIDGAYRAWRKGDWVPRPRKLTLRIGSPLRFVDKKPVKEDAVAIAATLRDQVCLLR